MQSVCVCLPPWDAWAMQVSLPTADVWVFRGQSGFRPVSGSVCSGVWNSHLSRGHTSLPKQGHPGGARAPRQGRFLLRTHTYAGTRTNTPLRSHLFPHTHFNLCARSLPALLLTPKVSPHPGFQILPQDGRQLPLRGPPAPPSFSSAPSPSLPSSFSPSL